MSEHVPFRLEGGMNPLVLVPTYVDARGPYQFILDTGASQCVLSEQLASALAIKPECEKQAMGAGGAVKIACGRVNSLAVGSSREIHNGKHGRQASPILFRIATPSKPLILVPVFVDQQGPFQFALDTGAASTMLAPELARQLAIETTELGVATGGGGEIRISSGIVTSLAVGEISVHNHAVGVGQFLNMLSTAIGVKLEGIIGYNFLSQFQVTIDYPESTLDFSAFRAGGQRTEH
jgi:predicted aspartyl protease